MTQMITFLQAATSNASSIRAIAPVVYQRNTTITAGSGAAYTELLSQPASGSCAPAAGQIINSGCFDLKVKLGYLNADDCDECTVESSVSATPVPPAGMTYGALRTGYYIGVEAAKVEDTTIETNLPLQTFNGLTAGAGQTINWTGVGTFTNANVVASGTYGGLNGTTHVNPSSAASGREMTLTLQAPANYIGFFWHTMAFADAFFKFYNGATLVATVPGNAATLFGLPAGYNGNPDVQSGDGMNYKHAYVNIWLDGLTFDRVVFGGNSISIENMRVGYTNTLYPVSAEDVELIIPKNSAFPLPEGLVYRIQMQTIDSAGAPVNVQTDQQVRWYSSYTPGCGGCVKL